MNDERRSKVAYLDHWEFAEMVAALAKGESVRVLGWPDGAKIEGVTHDFFRNSFAIRFSHPNFEKCIPGCELPCLERIRFELDAKPAFASVR